MFKKMLGAARSRFVLSATPINPVRIEGMEDRCLMHGGFGGFGLGFAGGDGGVPSVFGGAGLHVGRTIEFGPAPAAVQGGMKSLASTNNVAAPTATTTVLLGNFN